MSQSSLFSIAWQKASFKRIRSKSESQLGKSLILLEKPVAPGFLGLVRGSCQTPESIGL